MNNTVNIIGRIDPEKKGEIGTKEFTEQIKEQMDKYAGINVDDKDDGQHAICDLQYVLGYNGTMKTDCKGMTTTTNPIKKIMKDIENLTSDNIAAKLPKMLKDLDANMKLQGQYFIVAYLPYDDSKNIKADGRMMLVKFLDNEDEPELFTIYNDVQSKNHKITLGQSEKYRLINGKYISDKKAATKLQALSRGNKGRQDAKTVRTEKEAAEKIQALTRGNIGRQKAKEKEQKRVDYENEKEDQKKMQENLQKNIMQSKIDRQKEFEIQQQQKAAAEEAAEKKLAESNRKAALKAEEEFQQRQRAAQEQRERAARERKEQAEREEKKRAAEEKQQRKLEERDAREKQEQEDAEKNARRWEKEDEDATKEHERKIAAAKEAKEVAEKEARKTRKNRNKQPDIDAIAAAIDKVGVDVKRPNRKTRKQRLQTSFDKRQEGRAALKQEEANENERIRKELIIKSKDELINLSEKYHDSTFVQRVAHNLSPEKHTERKQNLIKDINTQIDIYNSNSTGLRVEPLNVENLSEKSISIIRDALNVVISQMGPRGGKSTRRRRRKVIPTRKRDHKKPKTKKKSNKGVVKRRKTRRVLQVSHRNK